MKIEILKLLRCPKTGVCLILDTDSSDLSEVTDGWLVSAEGSHRYRIRNGIPRFVPESNYADNFGMQWNHFAKTQLDSYSGHSISGDRFRKATGWQPEKMRGRWILDAGCGAGRFAEIALQSGAQVVALDYSSAADACYENLKHYPNLHVVQGDIYALPFEPGSFDFVYSLGVLQHTPDVEKAFAALPPMLTSGGQLCVDYYEKTLKSFLLPKFWLRPFTKRMQKQKLFKFLEMSVPAMLAVSIVLNRIPVVGKLIKRLVPVANYDGILPLTATQMKEWALLDTFDWLAPAYDQPQSASTAKEWCERAGLQNIELLRVSHLVARGARLATSDGSSVSG